MSVQMTLTEDSYMVVDLTCSTKRVWPRFAKIRLDVDPDVHPDMTWDGLKIPLPDQSADELYYDPPHYIGRWFGDRTPKHSRWFASVNRRRYPTDHFMNCIGRFGQWPSRAKWEEALKSLNIEARRVLKQGGLLFVKLSEIAKANKSVQRKDVDLLTGFEVVKEKCTISKYGKNPTYWLTMRPKASPAETGKTAPEG